jgi:hypothetical protein
MDAIMTAAVGLKLKLEEIKTEPDTNGIESALSNRKAEAGRRDHDRNYPPLFHREKADRRTCPQVPIAGYLFPEGFVDEGGLMSYGVDFVDQFRKAAHYADKILKGAKPADLPVQQATRFEFIINLKAAKQIGLTIPGNVLERADKVIK